MPFQRSEDARPGGLGSHIRKAIERRRLAMPPPAAPAVRRTVMLGKPRRDIFVELCRRPCQTASQVASSLRMSRTNVLWHVQALLKAGFLIKAKRDRAAFYLPTNLLSDGEVKLFQTLSDPTVRRSHIKIRERPGLSHGELTKAMGITRQALHWQVLKLVELNLVEVLVDGKYRRYAPTTVLESMARTHSRRTAMFRAALMKALREDGTAPSIVRVLPRSVLFKLRAGPRSSVLEVSTDPYDWALRPR